MQYFNHLFTNFIEETSVHPPLSCFPVSCLFLFFAHLCYVYCIAVCKKSASTHTVKPANLFHLHFPFIYLPLFIVT